jgi:hypothetical protein
MVRVMVFNNILVISWQSVFWWRKPEYSEKITIQFRNKRIKIRKETVQLLYMKRLIYLKNEQSLDLLVSPLKRRSATFGGEGRVDFPLLFLFFNLDLEITSLKIRICM